MYQRLTTNALPSITLFFEHFLRKNHSQRTRGSGTLIKSSKHSMGHLACIVLSAVDKKWNVDKFKLDRPLRCLVLNPPLRQDFLELYHAAQEVSSASTCKTKRNYITCCSRLEPSKRPDRFVSLVCSMSDFFKGAETSSASRRICNRSLSYADELVSMLKKHFNIGKQECLIMGFKKDPEDLKNIWIKTLLNIHPALYESYGMTIVEASTFGAPTLLDSNASIGAEDLFHGPNRFTVDMSDIPKATAYLKKLLADEKCCSKRVCRLNELL